MKMYRVSTTAELEQGTRDEVFDVEADEFIVSRGGGVRVVRWRSAPPGLWGKLVTLFRPVRENVAWVPHDALLSVRLLPGSEDGGPEDSDSASRTAVKMAAQSPQFRPGGHV